MRAMSPLATRLTTEPALRMTPRPLGYATFAVNYPAPMVMEPHAHQDHELNVAVSGGGFYQLNDGQRIIFSAGQILLMPAGVAHFLRVEEHVAFSGLLLHPDLLLDVLQGLPASHPARALARMTGVVAPRVVTAPGLLQVLLELYGQTQLELTRQARQREACLLHLGKLAAINLVRLMELDPRATTHDPTTARVLSVRDWLDRHFAERLSVEQLAAMAHLSPSHFAAVFRRELGVSPKTYLIRQRLEQAAQRLTTTGLSILEIAFSVGFEHLAHFNRSFKEHHGQTPGEYRRRHRREV
jgi:AraC-like DNA-binding protein/quercetin dioxygenase-like cupin family protein